MFTRRGVTRFHSPLACLQREDAAVGGVVVHDEQAQVGELRLCVVEKRDAVLRSGLEGQRELKCRAVAGCTLRPHLAAHQFHEATADGQTQSSAAEMSRGGGVRLHEWTEQLGEAFWRNADAGVAHREMKLPRRRGILRIFRRGGDFDLRGDLAPVSELHSVADEVDENLAQACDIAEDIDRNAIFNLIDEINLFFASLRTKQIQGFLDTGAQINGLMFKLQHAGFNLREIKNVVDDSKQ